MRTKAFVLLAFLFSLPAFGAARHVYLNSTGGGSQLNDCPNPAHNLKGTSNTDELSYCIGAILNNAVNRFICDAGAGCKAWTTTTGTCTSPANGGTVAAVTNNTLVNIEATGTGAESDIRVYGHPQACVWNMAKSDSCEIHAGTYRAAGAESNGLGVTPGGCDRSDCWLATVVAFGYGPNMGTTGYGTAANPAYLRGAVMNGSTDTWDSNNNKTPDSSEGITSYPVIFDGNVNGNGTNDTTSCGNTVGSCTGDAFYALIWGCGDTNGNGGNCLSSVSGQIRPQVDSDGNGTFDTNANSGGSKNVSYFTVKDIRFTGYNGGATTCTGNGIREGLGHFYAGGGGATSGNGNGFTLDHIQWDNDTYTNLCVQEHYVAMLGDDENWACSSGATVISNSYIDTKNRVVINDDCDASDPGSSECGCSKTMHDNRVIFSNTTSGQYQGIVRLKSLDTVNSGARAKVFRFYNNEFIWQRPDSGSSDLIYPECMGKCDPEHLGLGEFWFYGNIVRMQGSSSPAFHRFSQFFCSESIASGGGGTNWHYYNFNNTFDIERIGGGTQTFDAICNTTGALAVSRNNVWRGGTTVNSEAATTLRQTNNICDQSGQTGCTQNGAGRTGWWTDGTQNRAVNAGLANYVPKPAGPLYEITGTACDPDGDGAAGVDYDGDGVNDTQWTDIAGNVVKCPAISSALSYGAVQPNSDAAPVCGNSLVESGETCDDGNTVTETSCNYGTPSCTLCNAGCTATLNLTGPYCGDSILNGSEFCDTGAGYVLPASCVSLGFSGGTLTCASNCLSYNTTGCTTTTPGKTANALTLSGGSIH